MFPVDLLRIMNFQFMNYQFMNSGWRNLIEMI
jgi:hypothetical protein